MQIMYFILNKDGSKAFYLFENEEYVVGRKSCDIMLEDDTSISRKHASLSVKEGKIHITDLGARYNTFVNKNKLEPNVITKLNINDEITFGISNTIYIIKEQKINTTCSGLTQLEKKSLSKIMTKLCGNMLATWSKECSYLTVNEIMLTLKALCALIDGQPIVTMNFWINYVENVKKNLPPPDPNHFKAVYAESVLNRHIIDTNKESRKSLFKDKIFVFKTKLSIAKIEAAVDLAGGTCICWNENKITKEKFSLSNPQYLLIQDDDKNFNQNDSFMNMIKYLQSIGKRSIPFQEIAMAIVTGSCEKNCNPDFDRIGILVKSEQMVFTSDILATESQTQSDTFEEKPTIIIPETEDVPLSVPKPSTRTETPSTSSTKREGQQIGNDNKRIRLESMEVGGYSSVFDCDPSNNFGSVHLATSTQDQSKVNEDIDVKPLESIDAILNETGELDSYKAKLSSKESKKDLDEYSKLKRKGPKLNENNKRIRLETSDVDGEVVAVTTQKLTVTKPDAVIDLTQGEDKIVTSTQISKSNVRHSLEMDIKNTKPENPFGFTRREPKSKSNATARISEFFKPLSKTTQNLDESFPNISRISTDSTLGSRKDKSPEKSNKVQNPFALNKQNKNTNNEFSFKKMQAVVTKDDRNKINPFGDLRRTYEKTKKNCNENTERDEVIPYSFDIAVIDLDMERKFKWLSKNISIKDEVDNSSRSTTQVDASMQKFLDSFDNCVIVEILPEPVERTYKRNEPTINDEGNFKKFRKVLPLHMQRTIIPRSLYSFS